MFNYLSLSCWFNFYEISQNQFLALLFILFILYDFSFAKKMDVKK